MSILIYFLIFLVIVVIYLKLKERSAINKIVHTKTGKVIPHFTIFHAFVRLFKRYALGKDMMSLMRENIKMKGDTYASFFLSKMIITVTNANDIREILTMKDFSKPNEILVFGPMFNRYLGKSLTMLNDEPWTIQRKAINSAMGYSKIKEFISIFNKIANTLVEKIKTKKGEFVEVNEEFTLMTFDVIGKAGFGFDFNSLSGNENKYLNNMQTVLNNLLSLPSILFGSKYDNLPLKKNKELKETCENVDKWIEGIIQERREKRKNQSQNENNENENENKQNKKDKDLLDLILDAEKEENLNLTSKELHNNIFLFFFAGHDTSSSTLTSVLYFLAKYPEYIDQAREEVLRELGGEQPTFEQIQKLSICNAIIKESLRLLPPVTVVTGRVSNVDVEIGGYFVPKDSFFTCLTFTPHFDEKYWEKPMEFNPKRFLEGESKEAQKNAYFPFGYGPRRCPGDKFALAEICVTLVAFLQNFKSWEFKEGYKFVNDGRALTTKPKDGLPLKFVSI